MMQPILFVYNPFAGKGQINGLLSEIVQQLSADGSPVTLLPTQKEKNVFHTLSSDFYRYAHVFAAGGDGTLNQMVESVMQLPKVLRPSCAYLPAGTVNDFASSLSIPKDPLKAARLLTQVPQPFSYDIGSINRRYFTYIAGFGAFTEVSYETPQSSKNLLGKTAYLLNGIKRLSNLKSYQINVTAEDKIIEDTIIYGMICNTYSVGGFMKFKGDHIDLCDGQFEVILIKTPKTLADFNQLILDLSTQNTNSPHLHCFHSSHLRITCEEEIPWVIDGEFGGCYKNADIHNHQQAITFIVPASENK